MSVQEIEAELDKLSLEELRRITLKTWKLAATRLKPFTAEESKEAFASDPEWDIVTAAMSRLPLPYQKKNC
jgi:hypothetical protein